MLSPGSAMNDKSSSAGIAGFASETALVNGVRIHYWFGGDSKGPPCAAVAWVPGNQLRLE
jgi:hypothetical protein